MNIEEEIEFLRVFMFCYMLENNLKEIIVSPPKEENYNKRLRLRASSGINDKNIGFLKVELK